MTKYSEKFKLSIINLCLANELSISTVSKKYSVSTNQINLWIRKFKLHNAKGIIIKHKKRKFTTQFILSVLDYKETNHLSRLETALLFDIRDSVIYTWEHKLSLFGLTGFNQKRGRPPIMIKKQNKTSDKYNDLVKENQKLQQQLRYTQMELEVTKKLNALALKKSPRKNGQNWSNR